MHANCIQAKDSPVAVEKANPRGTLAVTWSQWASLKLLLPPAAQLAVAW